MFSGLKTTGLTVGMNRETATRFFIPTISAYDGRCSIYRLKDLSLAALDLPFVIGIVMSVVVSYLAIQFLLQYLRHSSYLVFAIYRFPLALIALITIWVRQKVEIKSAKKY
ncbi:MAG TPA: hypothetical protein GXX69_10250 [Firmicutes bacterium]|nr:hypothetical protein [Bacillota bacterium]